MSPVSLHFKQNMTISNYMSTIKSSKKTINNYMKSQ